MTFTSGSSRQMALAAFAAVHHRHMDIHENDVRPQLTSQLHCVHSIARFADDFDAPIRFHELADGLPHHIMIICDHDAGGTSIASASIASPIRNLVWNIGLTWPSHHYGCTPP